MCVCVCGMNYAFLGSDNDSSPVRNRVTVWTNVIDSIWSIFQWNFHFYFLGQPSEWYPFGPCQITYKMMLNAMHCHHIVGLEISAKALMPLSQIPPECARSYCMPFHTSRSALSCNL